MDGHVDPPAQGAAAAGDSPRPMDAERYLRERVKDQLDYYSAAAGRAKRYHYGFQSAMIVLAAAVPILVNLNADSWPLGDPRAWATAMSFVVAVLGGLSAFRKDGELWTTYRRTEELLKRESFLFRTSAGPYAGLAPEERLPTLSLRVEGLLATEHDQFQSLVNEAGRRDPPKAGSGPSGGTPARS